jgi:hypothetical protein
MARFLGWLTLMLGLGMTTYLGYKERPPRLQPGNGTELHSMEGGDPMPVPEPRR